MAYIKDIQGQRFGRWTVIRFSHIGTSGAAMWWCKCDCGTERAVQGSSLRMGLSKSCGCLGAEHRKEAVRKAAKHHGRNERLYGVWRGIIDRCENPKSKYYYRYGSRGISICDEWRNDYAAFRTWALENGYDDSVPKGVKTLDRIDNDGDYSPNNCTWHNMEEQSNNRSSNRVLEYNGEKHTAAQWARILGFERHTILHRIDKLGWDVERALTTPNMHTQRKT